MPNWVYNSLTIEGSKEDIKSIKKQVNKPFQRQHDQWNPATGQMELQDTLYPNPIFAFYRDWETDRKSTRLNSSHRL